MKKKLRTYTKEFKLKALRLSETSGKSDLQLSSLGGPATHLRSNMEEGFRRFLKRDGRSESAAGRVIAYVREFRGINPEYVEKLAAVGIRNVKQMLEVGKTERGRAALSEETGVVGDVILELVKLSDLRGYQGSRAFVLGCIMTQGLIRLKRWRNGGQRH